MLAVEGAPGVGKTYLIRYLSDAGLPVRHVPDNVLPSKFLDSPLLGQGVFFAQLCMKSALARQLSVEDCPVIEHYAFSVLAHHWSSPQGSFDLAKELLFSLIAAGSITPPRAAIIVTTSLQLLGERSTIPGDDSHLAYQHRQLVFFRDEIEVVANELEIPLLRLERAERGFDHESVRRLVADVRGIRRGL